MPDTLIQILSRHRPALLPRLDDNSRTVYSCNFDVLAVYPTGNWLMSIAKLIEDENIADRGVDLFIGVLPSMAKLPADTPILQLLETPGDRPDEAHDNSKQERNSFQLLVRSTNPQSAFETAQETWKFLDGKRDITVSL